jgi:hypothetical protein
MGEAMWSRREWCLDFALHEGVRIDAVLSGECWLSVEGVRKPVKGKAGDCLLLPTGRPFRVGSNLKLPALDADRLALGDGSGVLIKRYAGNAFLGLGSYFRLSGEHASLLTSLLPPILHIQSETDKAVLRWTLDRLAEELREPQPGGSLVVQQLSTMLVVQALRVHLDEDANGGVGWLFALRDQRMRLALVAMHAWPSNTCPKGNNENEDTPPDLSTNRSIGHCYPNGVAVSTLWHVGASEEPGVGGQGLGETGAGSALTIVVICVAPILRSRSVLIFRVVEQGAVWPRHLGCKPVARIKAVVQIDIPRR